MAKFIETNYFIVIVSLSYCVSVGTDSALIHVNMLRISTVPLLDVGLMAALERIRVNRTLSAKFNISLTLKSAERTPTTGIGPTLRVILDELTKSNTTYAFIVGPDFTPELVAVGQMMPVYNIIQFGGSGTSKIFSDKKSFPLFYRGGAKGPDYTRAFLSLIKTLSAPAITTLALNEQYAVDGIRDVEQSMIAGGVRLQYSGVFDDTNRAEVADNIMKVGANYIVAVFFGVVEPKIVCDLFRKKLSADRTLYLVGGPFGIQDWWMPRPSDPDWKCSLADFASALNGSFLIDQFVDDGHYPIESMRTKIGGLNGIELDARFRFYLQQLKLPRLVSPAYSTYDVVWSAFDALYRTEARLKKETNVTLDVALSFSTYKSREYATYSKIMTEELHKTVFYGITGDFRYDINNDRQMDLQIFQFQPPASTPNTTYIPLVIVGNYSVRYNVINFHNQLVRYATPNNAPPHLWELAQQQSADQWSQNRLIIILVVCGAVVLVALAAGFWWLYKRRRQQAADLSWLIPYESVKIIASKHRRAGRGGSMFSTQSHLSLISGSVYSSNTAAGKERGSIGLDKFSSEMHDGSVPGGRGRARINTSPVVEVWMRKFPQTLNMRLAARQLSRISKLQDISLQVAAELNALFPHAATLRSLSQQHANINRFVGICLGTDDGGGDQQQQRQQDAMLFFDYAPKGALRPLILYNDTFSLDLTLKYSFMHDVACAVQYMHAQASDFGRAHGLLHSNNVVLDNKFTAKVTDYGFWETRPAKDFKAFTSNNAFDDLNDEALELLLARAPEVLKSGMIANNGSAELKTVPVNMSKSITVLPSADVYSMGMIFMEIFARHLPYLYSTKPIDVDRDQVEPLLQYIIHGNEPAPPTEPLSLLPPKSSAASDDIDPPLAELLFRCTNVDALMRPSASDVVKLIRTTLPNYTPSSSVIESLIARLQSYATNLEGVVVERTRALADEMERSEQLLLQILPRSVAQELKAGRAVDPEWFDLVSVYFSDIVGFTTLSAESTPMQVVVLLNALYTMFDAVLGHFDVYKVETIGDAYMVASGLPVRNECRHLSEIASMSLQLLVAIRHFEIPHKPRTASSVLQLRIGLHCGPCVAGVVGIKMPRYCLFGDTINTASRMESSGEAMKIHVSQEFNKQLHFHFDGKFVTNERGVTDIKGKGAMITFWLTDVRTG